MSLHEDTGVRSGKFTPVGVVIEDAIDFHLFNVILVCSEFVSAFGM